MKVDITRLPREHGFPIGQYHLSYSTISVTMPGAQFVDGKTVEPITGRVLQRLRMAYGVTCIIETADAETEKLVREYWESIGHAPQGEQVEATGPTEPTRSPAPAPQAEPVEPQEPVIDDDIDEIDNEDILVAIATGLGLETEGVGMPELRLNIRKAREPKAVDKPVQGKKPRRGR